MSDAGSDAGEAYRRVSLLAAEHRADLDAPARLMAAQAWVGGGAPRFADALAAHRASLQRALTAALATLAQECARRGEPASAPVFPGTHLTVATAARGPFQGIDVAAMTALVTALDQAADRLSGASARIRAELSALSLPAAPGWTIAQSAEWAATQAPDLRRRLTKIRTDSPWIPSSVAAFTLFGGSTPGSGTGFDSGGGFADADALLRLSLAGDFGAVKRLQDLRDPSLAARINAWWHSLTDQDRERLVTLPGIGALNGLPAAFRDRANRHALAAEKARLTAELARITTSFTPQDRDRLLTDLRMLSVPYVLGAPRMLEGGLRNIAMVERALATGGTTGHPPAYLLAFDQTGTGRIIVSWGDPDQADTTVTYVPGLNTELSGFAGDIDRARVLWQQAQATAGDKRIASIAWLGYDPPQIESTWTPGISVAGDAPADRGAHHLASFTDGLRAAHTPSTTGREVILGHSYGSLVSGKAALLRPGTLADTFIFVGSPGVGVPHAQDLGIPPSQVWVGEDPNDPVAKLGHFTQDPGSKNFGAQHFPVGRTSIFTAHSNYWETHSTSLRNIAYITNGQHKSLVSAKHDITPQLLMPELQKP